MRSRNLDDQTFEQIVLNAVNKIPQKNPEWTDFNEHDPGITLIELFAWYKEMQQYHMNVFTDQIQLKLLKLLGVEPKTVSPARCCLKLSKGEGTISYPRLSRFRTAEGIVFETDERIELDDTELTGFFVKCGESFTDVTQVLLQNMVPVQPFSFDQNGNDKTEFYICVDTRKKAGETLKLWCEITDNYPVKRNPFKDEKQAPRRIEYDFSGAGRVKPTLDETHALSKSGFIAFTIPEGWTEANENGLPESKYIRFLLTRAGCEEKIRIGSVLLDRVRATQRETWTKTYQLTAPADSGYIAELNDWTALIGETFIFGHRKEGLVQLDALENTLDGAKRRLTLDCGELLQDIKPNLYIICIDKQHLLQAVQSSNGLPAQRIELDTGGQAVIREDFALMCDSKCPDGKIRPRLWRYTDNLLACGPRDRAFTYDDKSSEIVFGDGRHGAIVPAGENAVLLSSFATTLGRAGNIPEKSGLYYDYNGAAMENTAAMGGADAQTPNEAADEFVEYLSKPCRCVTLDDYRYIALNTPGLRIAHAKAIAGYDPNAQVESAQSPVVTLVVIPFNTSARPVPNAEFLAAVRLNIEKHRTVCTSVRVIGPKYVPINVSAEVCADGDAEKEITDALNKWFWSAEGGEIIGRKITVSAITAAIASVEGVLKVSRTELGCSGDGCRKDNYGNITTVGHAVAYLNKLELTTY